MSKTDQSLHPAVVLVADRTLAANYKALFEGMFATMQTTQTPAFMMRRLLAPPVAVDPAGRAHTAPLGLRRIEASLLTETSLGPEDIVCTTPEALHRLLGPWTRLVGVASSDPLGGGMSNTTTANLSRGELYSRKWTADLLAVIRRAKARWPFGVLFGGGGAWQWGARMDLAERAGIDTVFEGYFEDGGPGLIADILAGKDAPRRVVATSAGGEGIRPIRGASLLGVTELSRGCGRGCKFCTMAHKRMYHLPAETVLADLETNLAAGLTSVVSGSEDLFRYGSTGPRVNFAALVDLLERMRSLRGLGFMQIDHANISSVAQLSDDQLAEVRRLLTWGRRNDYLWVNMGVETANGELAARSCRGKMLPYGPAEWEDIVRQVADKMARAGFFCVFSIILGLPGETPADVQRTHRLVEDLTRGPAVFFPIFHEPLPDEVAAGAQPFTTARMWPEHLELFAACYEVNFRKIPRLYWDNQRAAGVSWYKRMLIQTLGRTEVFTWRRSFRRIGKRIAARQAAETTGEPRAQTAPESV